MLSKAKKRIWISLIAILSLLCVFTVYVGVYYSADEKGISEYISKVAGVEEKHLPGVIAVGDTKATTAFIFYPGGKVEHTAYLPLMYAVAKEGILCLLVEMPFRLAVFDSNAADKLLTDFPDVTNRYIGGHSLGGAMAAHYASSYAEKLQGLVLLGAYSSDDLTKTSLSVLSIYGSEDGVLNRKKYESNRAHYPSDFTEQIIEGGCHAYFGMFGKQRGDGTPTIGNVEQIDKTASLIVSFIKNKL